MANICLGLPWLYALLLITLIAPAIAQETYTNAACITAAPAMNSCAQRWDSIRLECKNSSAVNTIWPGPCECSYYANDLPCFDDQALCAAQVWTQVPQWFREGVSSCIMNDASYTIRAALGNATASGMGNPFTVPGLRGRATRTSEGVARVTPAQTGASAGLASSTGSASEVGDGEERRKGALSTGAKAGFGVGIGVGTILIAIAAILIARNRKKPDPVGDAEKRAPSPFELHDDEAQIHQMSSQEVYPKMEMEGCEPKRHELGVEASTWLVELPVDKSSRHSRQ